ncbi:hypothetical protein [Lysobacter fragariae]
MPHCTVRYSVRLVPKTTDAPGLDAIGIFDEERTIDEVGAPGKLIFRRLATFSGPAGYAVRDLVTRGEDWKMDVLDRIGPLEWDH